MTKLSIRSVPPEPQIIEEPEFEMWLEQNQHIVTLCGRFRGTGTFYLMSFEDGKPAVAYGGLAPSCVPFPLKDTKLIVS